MSKEDSLPRIMVTCAARIPSVELGAIIPLSELQKQELCVFRYKDEMLLSLGDIAWCDILFIVRGASFRSVWAAKWAKKLDRIVLIYWDDDFLSIPSYSLCYPYYSSAKVRENVTFLFGVTDAFFSPSPKLAAKLSSMHGTEARVLPVAFGAERLYPPKQNIDRVPIVGYAGGLDHINLLNSLLAPVIAALADTGINFRAHILGPKPDFIGRLPIETTHTPYIENYYDYLALASKLGWDIGLAPQMDSEFTTYKFYNKLLEYTHIGCAGIYSKMELYTSVIEDGVTGLLVDNEVEAWKDATLRLLKDPELRFTIASNAYEFVKSHHNRGIVVEQYADVLQPFLGYRAPKVRKIYIFMNEALCRFGGLWGLGTEYLKIYGTRRLIRAAPRYLFSLIYHRLRAGFQQGVMLTKSRLALSKRRDKKS